jgi:hypothetical protein
MRAEQSRVLDGYCPFSQYTLDVEIHFEMCRTPGNPEYTLHLLVAVSPPPHPEVPMREPRHCFSVGRPRVTRTPTRV